MEEFSSFIFAAQPWQEEGLAGTEGMDGLRFSRTPFLQLWMCPAAANSLLKHIENDLNFKMG